MYSIVKSEQFEKLIKKLLKKDRAIVDAIFNKVSEIAENPYHYKPLRAPTQGFRRVHIMSCFVLTYSIDENAKTIILQDFAHHDEAYH